MGPSLGSSSRLELFFRLEVNKVKARARSSFFLFKIENLLYKSVGLGKSSSLMVGSKYISHELDIVRALKSKLELGSGSIILGSTHLYIFVVVQNVSQIWAS